MASSATAFSLPDDFIVDVHTHPVPEFFKDALIEAGELVIDGKVVVDGFMTPDWDAQSYVHRRKQLGCNFSILSVTAPGVTFVRGAQGTSLARKLNEFMGDLIESYPSHLGAFGVLPLPDIAASLEEIIFCLDTRDFDGIGLYTNYNGIYLGHPALDPVMRELNERKVTVFVHPAAPGPTGPTLDLGAPVMEYTFDTTRAIGNIILHDTVTKFPDIKFIFSHGGGTLPFLADRLSGIMSIPQQGGKNRSTTEKIFRSFYFDLATSCSHPQLAALNSFVGSGHLLIGTDDPYFPQAGMVEQLQWLKSYGFSKDQLMMIRHGNALSLFPKLVRKVEIYSKT